MKEAKKTRLPPWASLKKLPELATLAAVLSQNPNFLLSSSPLTNPTLFQEQVGWQQGRRGPCLGGKKKAPGTCKVWVIPITFQGQDS